MNAGHSWINAVCAAGVCVSLFAGAVRAAEDACEFRDLDDAQMFGWDALPGAGFNAQAIVWAPLKKGGFNDLENFGTMVFK